MHDCDGVDAADPASAVRLLTGGFIVDGADNARLKAILRHTDLVTCSPKDAVAGDIATLKAAGIKEEDIVRLSELIAFVNYQVRVVAGLRLMAAAS